MNMTLFEAGLAGKPLKDVFVADMHAHCGARKGIDRDITMESYLRQMDAVGIDLTCLSAFPPSAGVTLQRHNDLVREFISFRPDRFKGYCWINPAFPELIENELHRCFDKLGFSGIKIHTHSNYPYDGERYRSMYQFADERGLPILAHTWGSALVSQFASMARQYPRAHFLLGHAGAKDPDLACDEACRSPNLFLELSFSAGTPYLVERFVRDVGADRLIWGSDEILFSSAHQIGKVLFADISDEDKCKILGENARRILRLAPDAS